MENFFEKKNSQGEDDYIPLISPNKQQSTMNKQLEEMSVEELYSGKYACALNKNKEEIPLEQQTLFLSKITHIMDCECYQFKGGKASYREVTLLELQTKNYFIYHCYDDKLKPYNELTRRERSTVYHQYRCHGLNYLSQKTFSNYFSQSELINKLQFLFDNVFSPNAIIGYKGGDKETSLVKILHPKNNIYCINLEYLGIEKYEYLLSFYNLKPKNCGGHTSKPTSLFYHCSLFECLLFAACLFRKLEDVRGEQYVLTMYDKEFNV